MNKYESVVIFRSNNEEKHFDEIEKKYRHIIESNQGQIEKVDRLGDKKLAYDVKGNSTGCYMVFYFNAERNLISELERQYRIDDDVLKFMTIRADI